MAELSYVNIFQVYIKSDAGIGHLSKIIRTDFGVRTRFSSRNQTIAVHFALPQIMNAELRLYNIQGKCVLRDNFAVRAGRSTFLWNLGALSNGKYILTVKAGLFLALETLLIIN